MKYFFLFLGLLLLAHFPLLVVNQIENPDAGIIFLLLKKLQSPALYLDALVNFRTLDFQPVRDLTFFVEMFVYNQTGYVISVLLNVIVFAGCVYQFFRILREEGTEMSGTASLLYAGCFAVYPIFLQSVNWGTARKHLLALFFILYATRKLIALDKERFRILPIVLSYVLSVLSLPMAIAWPFWALLRRGPVRSLREPDSRKLFAVLFTIMLLLVGLNFAYYKTSYTFLEIYPQKARGLDPLLILTNLGLQFKQLIYPYELSFYYNNDDSIFVGFATILVLTILIAKRAITDKRAVIWPAFGGLALVVTLSTPDIYYDPYLNFVVTGVALFIGVTYGKFLEKFKYVLVIPLIFWTSFTIWKSYPWKDFNGLFTESYRYNPNCTTATLLGRRMYMQGQKLPDELYNYIQVQECLKGENRDSPMMGLQKMTFEAASLFMEEDIDREYRYQRLEELGRRHHLPMSVLAALYARHDRPEEFEKTIAQIVERLKPIKYKFGYDFIVSKYVFPYCREKKLPSCPEFLKLWDEKNTVEPFF